MEYFFIIITVILINQIIYDKYIQRKHQLLINYPLIGRMRFFFEALREPFRQYFGDEDFYESKDKVDWVYNASKGKTGYISFSPSQPQPNPKFLIKHSNFVLNDDEINDNFSVTFGEKREYPYISKSIIYRSAMSDGAISPEGTKAFSKASSMGQFAINTGEGSLTTNFFITHRNINKKCMNIINITGFDKFMFNSIKKMLNHTLAIKYLKSKHIKKGESDTFLFDANNLLFFRPNWSAPLDVFPKTVPEDLPDIIYQISSGFYGSRDKDGNFDEKKYQKTMSFCRMTEIKLAQGAKQTGGKLTANKVTPSIAYYRGVEANKNVYSPNRFPFASNIEELFNFIARLQKLSKKPVGIKIVISSKDLFLEYASEIKKRKDKNIQGIPDFITIDGGDGGSATAPLFLMDRVGLQIKDAIHIADSVLKNLGVRDEVKLAAASKILTPDDLVIILALGADYVGIARGFMLSAGCIRARMCSGEGRHNCPVGLATQNEKIRRSYLIHKQSYEIKNYHDNLLKGVKTILAIMGKTCTSKLSKNDLSFIDKNGFIHTNVDRYLDKKLST
jgi:glutamate synthase domain-containing protein 2